MVFSDQWSSFFDHIRQDLYYFKWSDLNDKHLKKSAIGLQMTTALYAKYQTNDIN